MAKAEKKKSFIVYEDWQLAIDAFDEDVQNEVRKAIFFYGIGRPTPDLSPIAQGVFAMVRTQMDNNTLKHEEKRIRMQENGQKGGRPKKNDTETKENQNNQKVSEEPNGKNKTHNVNVNVNENVNVPLNNGGYNIKDTPQENLENKAREFIETYNKLVEGTRIPQARVTENRTIRTGKILYKMGWDTMVEVIQKASKSILAKDNMWVGFDWFLDEDNVVKVLEGTYDDTAANNNQGQGAKGSGMGIQEQRHIRQLRELAGGDEEQFRRLMETAGYHCE